MGVEQAFVRAVVRGFRLVSTWRSAQARCRARIAEATGATTTEALERQQSEAELVEGRRLRLEAEAREASGGPT